MNVPGARTADGSSHWHKAQVLPVSDGGGFKGVLWRIRSGVSTSDYREVPNDFGIRENWSYICG